MTKIQIPMLSDLVQRVLKHQLVSLLGIKPINTEEIFYNLQQGK